jgi:hypothetical protein
VRSDAEDDAVAAFRVGEAADGTGAAADFAEGAFDGVGGAEFFPVAFRHSKKAQQLIQVGFDAGYGVGAVWFPEEFPLAEGA